MIFKSLWKKINIWFSRKYCKRTNADIKKLVKDPVIDFYVYWKNKGDDLVKEAILENKVILCFPIKEDDILFPVAQTPKDFEKRLNENRKFIEYIGYSITRIVSVEEALGILMLDIRKAEHKVGNANRELRVFKEDISRNDGMPF